MRCTIRILNAENILARPYYYPALHKKTDNKSISGDLHLTEILAEKFINLPCGQRVDNLDIEMIVTCLKFIYFNADSILDKLAIDKHE